MGITIVVVILWFIPGLGGTDAHAAPGDRVGTKIELKGTARLVAWDRSRSLPTFTRTSDGGYIGVIDTSGRSFFGDPFGRETGTIRLFRLNKKGNVSGKFGKSTLGRGIRIGRRGESWDVASPTIVSQTRAYVVAVNEGFSLPGVGTIILAFNPRTGHLIKSFGSNGILRRGGRKNPKDKRAFYERPSVLRPEPDGSVLECGEGAFANTIHSYAYLRKISPRGEPVGSFASGGVLKVKDFLKSTGVSSSPACSAVEVDDQYRVLVAGTAVLPGTGDNPVAWVKRLDQDGGLDTSFGEGGTALVRPPGHNPAVTVSEDRHLRPISPQAIRVTTGGDILIAGWVSGWPYQAGDERFAAAFRLASTGSPDASFGAGGTFTSTRLRVVKPTIDDEGRVLFIGSTPTRIRRAAIMRVTPAGSFDKSFGVDGVAVRPTLDTSEHVSVVAVGSTRYALLGFRLVPPYGNAGETIRWDVSEYER